jgi:hypothetical protein
MYYDSFDICLAHYTFAYLFHGGQGCPIYAKFAQLNRLRFHPPACYDLRLHVLDSIAGTYGVEYIASPEDTFTTSLGIDYLNTGDSYALTIVRSAETGNYRVASWGDLVEKWL